jgi:hypothetical protein
MDTTLHPNTHLPVLYTIETTTIHDTIFSSISLLLPEKDQRQNTLILRYLCLLNLLSHILTCQWKFSLLCKTLNMRSHVASRVKGEDYRRVTHFPF